jgi:hypothetical protein
MCFVYQFQQALCCLLPLTIVKYVFVGILGTTDFRRAVRIVLIHTKCWVVVYLTP